MLRVLLTAAVFAIGCGGGSGGGGGNPSLRQACTKLCTCFEETSSFSGFSSSASSGNCVEECVTQSGSFSSDNSTGQGIPQVCIDCINGATCDAITSGSACTSECNF